MRFAWSGITTSLSLLEERTQSGVGHFLNGDSFIDRYIILTTNALKQGCADPAGLGLGKAGLADV